LACPTVDINEDNLIIEDEYHVFFNCPRYDDIRRNYMFNWYTGPTEVIYFYNIMSSDNENTIRNTALFINKLLKIVNNTWRYVVDKGDKCNMSM